MTEIYETQSERTDLPLVVMPSVLDSMIEPIKAQFPALHDVARVRMFEEFTSDEATIAEPSEGCRRPAGGRLPHFG